MSNQNEDKKYILKRRQMKAMLTIAAVAGLDWEHGQDLEDALVNASEKYFKGESGFVSEFIAEELVDTEGCIA